MMVATKTMCRWKLHNSVHSDKNAKMVTPVDPETLKGVTREPGDGIFYAGDVFDSDADLERHNYPGNLRFEKLRESNPDGLQDMSEEELYDFAESEDIHVPPAMSQEDLVRAIRGAVDYRSVTQRNIASQVVQTSPEEDDGLEKMSVAKLRKHAKENDIEVDETMDKEQLLITIRGAAALV